LFLASYPLAVKWGIYKNELNVYFKDKQYNFIMKTEKFIQSLVKKSTSLHLHQTHGRLVMYQQDESHLAFFIKSSCFMKKIFELIQTEDMWSLYVNGKKQVITYITGIGGKTETIDAFCQYRFDTSGRFILLRKDSMTPEVAYWIKSPSGKILEIELMPDNHGMDSKMKGRPINDDSESQDLTKFFPKETFADRLDLLS